MSVLRESTSAAPATDEVPVRPSSSGRGPAVLEVWQGRIERLRLPAERRGQPFPAVAWQRWLIRVAFAAPYLAVAFWQHHLRAGIGDSPNAQLLAQVARVDWTAADASWLHLVFPPISSLIAYAVPTQLGLATLGSLVVAWFLQRMLEIMAQRGYPPVAVALLMLALAASPLTAYVATQNFAGLLGLTFFGLGIVDCYRFVVRGTTQSGFRAGLLLGAAVLSATEALMYVAVAALALPFLTLGRHRGLGLVRSSQMIVVVFPTLAIVLSTSLVSWALTGDPLAEIGRTTFGGMAQRGAYVGNLIASPTGVFLILTVLSACAVGVIVRRPSAIVVAVAMFADILVSSVIGLLPVQAAGTTFLMMMILAIAVLPIARSVGRVIAVNLVALCQIGLAWGTALNRDVVVDWLHALGLG